MNLLRFSTVFFDTDIANDAKEEISKIDKLIDTYGPKLIDFAKLLVVAILIYIIGKKIIKWIVNIVNKALTKSNMEPSVAHFLTRLCSVGLYLLLVIIVVGYLGLPTSSLVALVGSAGLAVGLALQGALANFAGGVLILIMRPFKLGDYIKTSGNEGVVSGIDVFYTRLTTPDNRLVVIPNGTITGASVENVTANLTRRVDLVIPMEYSDDFDNVRAVLADIAKNNELVLQDSAHTPMIEVGEFGASSVNVIFRVWTKTENYWTVLFGLQKTVKHEFDKNNIAIPYDKLDVNIHNV